MDLGNSLQGISTTRNLLADDAMVPISSPLTPPLGDSEETDKKGAVVKRLKVHAIKKDIRQVTPLQDQLFLSMGQFIGYVSISPMAYLICEKYHKLAARGLCVL